MKSRFGLAPEWMLIAFLWVCYALNHADRQVVYTLFPALQKEFNYSDTTLGLTGALFLWVYGFCSPVSGILGDRWPRTKLVAGSLGVWSMFTVLSGLAPNGAWLLVFRGLLGVSESLFMPAAYGLMAAAHGPASRSKAIAIFGTSQLVGVAVGGSLSGFIAERLQWRASFWILGAAGILFTLPLMAFFRRMPAEFSKVSSGEPARLSSFLGLLKIPSLRLVTTFVAVSTFALFLVYTWLPTHIYDKFQVGLARAGFEASVYPQIGSALGLLTGSILADRYYGRIRSARFWVVCTAFFGAAPCIFLIGANSTLEGTRIAAMGFGFFAGFVAGNQAAASFDVVPPSLRASTIGVLNLLGALVSGFAPFLGGLARKTVGVGSVMGLAGVLYLITGFYIVYGTLRHFNRDHQRAVEPPLP